MHELQIRMPEGFSQPQPNKKHLFTLSNMYLSYIYYRAIRYLNRYITFTPEYIKSISVASFLERTSAYRGYPYVLGADGTNREIGIDCSHLISRALIDAGSMNPYFYRTAHYLKNLTLEVTLSEISP
jgi:hypothetical protein